MDEMDENAWVLFKVQIQMSQFRFFEPSTHRVVVKNTTNRGAKARFRL